MYDRFSELLIRILLFEIKKFIKCNLEGREYHKLQIVFVLFL